MSGAIMSAAASPSTWSLLFLIALMSPVLTMVLRRARWFTPVVHANREETP